MVFSKKIIEKLKKFGDFNVGKYVNELEKAIDVTF